MTLKRWYQLCLFLPLVLPLLFGVTCWVLTGHFFGAITPPRPEPLMAFSTLPLMLLSTITLWLMMGFIFGGIQYLIFVLLLLWFSRDKDVVFIGRLSFFMPLLFIPFCALGLFLAEPRGSAFSLAFFAIPYGYFYVGVVHALTWLMLRFGKVASSA